MTIESCLSDLRAAVDGARRLGLDVGPANGVLERAEQRLAFPGRSYVLALAGGTGVGKSSVLNALAGRMVSPVRAIRPTTGDPVGWVANTRRYELRGLLDWLGARHVVGHAEESLEHVAIIDLPDFDSVFIDHRTTVETLLPRVDALAWVVDPEKYDDGRLHDAYLRPLARHADRFLFILNKSDRLTHAQQEEIRADLERRLIADGIDDPPIFVISAQDGSGELKRLRETLASAADSKAMIADKVRVDALTAGRQLAIQAGLDATDAPTPLVAPARREAAVAAATAGALETVDLAELTTQARRAVRERARRRGAGLIGRMLSFVHRASGQQRRVADPIAFLRAWRSRGSVARTANPIRQLCTDAALAAPPAWRPRLMELASSSSVDTAVADGLDRVAARLAKGATVPESSVWPVLGVLQLIANGVLLFAVLWLVTLVFAPGVPVSTTDVLFLDDVPTPLLLLGTGALASYLLSVALHAHAGWVGGRWARRIGDEVRHSVEEAVTAGVVRPLDELEGMRGALWSALQRLKANCADEA